MPQRRPPIVQLFLGAIALALLLPPAACGYVGPDLNAGDNAGVGGVDEKGAGRAGSGGSEDDSGGSTNAAGGTWPAAFGSFSFGGDRGFGGEGGDFFAADCTDNCTCDGGSDCEFTCDPEVIICRPQCQQGSRCATDAGEAEEVAINCNEGSTCYVQGADNGATRFSCNGGGDCHFACGEGSSCGLSCTGFGDCSLDCRGAQDCTLHCANPNGCPMKLACSDEIVLCTADSGDSCDSACER